jgi:cellulose synthase/poly-beta-1,6-N-acetylglucosamine synthase-like glycosyltransferase
VKNEEENITTLVKSISEQDYPHDNFEVIFVNDNSTDNTLNILNKIVSDYKNFTVTDSSNKILPGKKGALTIGIEKANNPFILITDADSIPERQWLKSFAQEFEKGFDFVFGVVNIFQENSNANRIACFENLRTSILSFGLAGIGLPYSSGGASFGFRKESFEKIGGYKTTTETLSGDDDLLIREGIKNKMKVGVITNKQAFVHTTSPDNLNDYFKQKARHTSTSNFYLLRHKIILAIWHLMNLLLIFSPILSFINLDLLLLFFTKIIFDVIIVLLFQKKLGYKFRVLHIVYLQIEYELFLIVHYLSATFKKKIEWK